MTTRTNYILVDYENVQPTPEELALLHGQPTQLWVFLGVKKHVAPSFVNAMQGLGANAKYVTLVASGPNALDFHLTYYLGVLVEKEPAALFHVISKDTGYDPLIKYLNESERRVSARRWGSIREIPFVKQLVKATNNALLDLVIASLAKRDDKVRPRTKVKLCNALHSLAHKPQLTDEERGDLFARLCQRRVVRVVDGKLQYNLQTSA